jgi:hypothetical protein
MMLSKDSIDAVSDLIENRISMMHIGDRDDLREMVALKRALAELQGTSAAEAGVLKNFGDIPRRGRRRKVSDMMGEQA